MYLINAMKSALLSTSMRQPCLWETLEGDPWGFSCSSVWPLDEDALSQAPDFSCSLGWTAYNRFQSVSLITICYNFCVCVGVHRLAGFLFFHFCSGVDLSSGGPVSFCFGRLWQYISIISFHQFLLREDISYNAYVCLSNMVFANSHFL